MSNRAVDTRWLTHADFEPKAPHWIRRPRSLLAAGLTLLLALVATRGFFGDMLVTAGNLAAARQEKALLAAEVERLRTQLALETATRGELEQHAAQLNDKLADLTQQVEFLTARRTADARGN